MKVLVTGGCGYIGQHVVLACRNAGHEVEVIDRRLADTLLGVRYTACEIGNAFVANLKSDAVIHLAASISVGESVDNPAGYYRNNLSKGLDFLDMCRRWDPLPKIVFASSAAASSPMSPYAETKRAFEVALQYYRQAYGLEATILRFFNVAGGIFKEVHSPETHLIPLLVDAVLKNEPFLLAGTSYATPDGTCIRDYVNVADVALACVKALEVEIAGPFDIGSGQGHSVRQVISAVEKAVGRSINVVDGPKRAGDVASLISDLYPTWRYLRWQPKRSNLEEIVQDVVANRTLSSP